ncbi:MAG: hypothetical protein EBY20_09775, partial [Alphaproteobacteria bacterium]|nr:hypothetical protein [Alphaproteobacteria bacterium]
MNWSPEKILNDSNISELTYKNYNKMFNVGLENSVYYALNIINDINYIIDTTSTPWERNKNTTISTSCCRTSYTPINAHIASDAPNASDSRDAYNSDSNGNQINNKYEYINYFINSKLNNN